MELVLLGLVVITLWILLRSKGNSNVRTAPKYPQVSLEKREALPEHETKKIILTLPEASVRYVKDGDTFDAGLEGGKITIRLDSIDCPEDDQPWGDKATFGLVRLIGGRKVRLECHGVDDYSRTLATAYVWNSDANEWLNVNERMVVLGHAWVMHRYYGHLPLDRKDKLRRLERWAREKKVGLWTHENPTPPWQWRANGR